MSEPDRLLDHDFDGIREYDNPMPGWWKAFFIATILFAIGYWIWYGMGAGGTSELAAYKTDMAEFERERAAKTIPVTEADLWKMRSDPNTLALGRRVWNQPGKCFTCHREDGGGLICPNLSDDAWLHGKTLMDLYRVVSKGTPSGMPAWGRQLSQQELIAVVVYASTFCETPVNDGKKPEGNIRGRVTAP